MPKPNLQDVRQGALNAARAFFDSGRFREAVTELVSKETASTDATSLSQLRAYLTDCIQPRLQKMGMDVTIHDNPQKGSPALLLAQRLESDEHPTLLIYGHGDTVAAMAESWTEEREPHRVSVQPGDLEKWYGRGIADNKAQHMLVMTALSQVIQQRGRLGFNCVFLLEMGEELGSPGLDEFCLSLPQIRDADLFIACDGPRQSLLIPDIQTGARGAMSFRFRLAYRDQAHHSGNWGGALANPGIVLMHALGHLVGPKGEILVEGLQAPFIEEKLNERIQTVSAPTGPNLPRVQEWWGAQELSTAQRLFCANTFEVLSFITGNPQNPVGAIPSSAEAVCQIRFVAGSKDEDFLTHIRKALDEYGFSEVEVERLSTGYLPASRMPAEHPAIDWAKNSIENTIGEPPNVLPNFGGSVPNALFHERLGLPTLWIPHSYLGCAQHAPNEHVLAPLMRQGLAVMTGLFWDLGEDFPRFEPSAISKASGIKANE